MELNALPFPSLYNILIIIAFRILLKYSWSLLYYRVNSIYFISKKDIYPKIVYILVLILLTI
jgi:hypothetical protein